MHYVNPLICSDEIGDQAFIRESQAAQALLVADDIPLVIEELMQLHSPRHAIKGSSYDEVRMCNLQFHGKLLRLLYRPGTGDILALSENFFRPDTQHILAELALAPNSTIVDVGAHVGYFSLAMAAGLESPRIIAVEPLVENTKLLYRNFINNQVNSKVEECGISCNNGIKTFYPSGWWCSSTFEKDIAEARSGNVDRPEHYLTRPSRELSVIDLSTLFQRHQLESIDLLKLDCEGSELRIFQSDLNWLRRVNAILLDIHAKYVPFDSIKSAIELQGFRFLLISARLALFKRC